MSQQCKGLKQRYYRNTNTLSLCRPVILSGNFQSEHVAAGKVFKRRYYRNFNNLNPFWLLSLSGNVQSEQIAAMERFETTILPEY